MAPSSPSGTSMPSSSSSLMFKAGEGLPWNPDAGRPTGTSPAAPDPRSGRSLADPLARQTLPRQRDLGVQRLARRGEVVHARQVVGAHVLLQHEAVHRRRRAERGQLVVLDLLQQLRGHELVHVVGEDGGAGDPLAVDLAPAELRPAAVGHAHVQRVLFHLLPVLRGDDMAQRVGEVVAHRFRHARGA